MIQPTPQSHSSYKDETYNLQPNNGMFGNWKKRIEYADIWISPYSTKLKMRLFPIQIHYSVNIWMWHSDWENICTLHIFGLFEYIWHKYHMHISEWIRINQNRMDNSIFYTSYLYCVGCIYIAKENGHKSLMPHIGIVDDAFSVKLICAHPKLPLKGHNIKFWMEEKAFRQEGNSCTSLGLLEKKTLF